MVKVCLLFSLFLLAGCQTVKPRDADPTNTANVLIPIECPAPKEIQRPELSDLENITEQSSAGEVVRAYRLALQQIKGYARELEEIVNGYRRACASAAPEHSESEQPSLPATP